MRLEQLEMLVQKRLPADEVSTIAEHMQTCQCCREHAQELLTAEGGLSGYYQRLVSLSQGPGELSVSVPTQTNAVGIRIQKNFSLDTLGHKLSSWANSEVPSTPNLLGKYEILSRLGEGGFGNVYRARDTQMGREVAIKVLKRSASSNVADLSPEQILLEEARRSCRVNHPNIVQAREVAQADGFDFLVMDLIEGQALSSYLRHGPLPVEQAVTWIQQVCQGLCALHSKEVLHLDIKPSNILIEAGTGKVMIADIGLERAIHDEGGRTTTRALGGTPAYMSPEQVNQEPVDARSDLFSLGVVFYELLTDTRPFQGDLREVAHQICQQQPRSPQELRSKLPVDLNTIVMKCLEKQPDRRYASVQELHDDLQRWKDHRPILARPISPARRLALWSRRNRWSLAACLSLAMVALFFMERTWRISYERAQKVAALDKTRTMLSQQLTTLARLRANGQADEIVATQLVEPLVPYYQEILDSRQETHDFTSLADTNFRMAHALEILHRPEAALKYLQIADVLFATLTPQATGSARDLARVAEFHLARPMLYQSLGQPLDAERASVMFDEAVNVATQLTRVSDLSPHQDLLAFAYINQAAHHEIVGRPRDSIAARRSALGLLEANAKTASTFDHGLVLQLHLDLSRVFRQLNDQTQAIVEQKKAKDIWRQLPLGEDFLHNYIKGLVQTARQYATSDRYELSNQSLGDALQVAFEAIEDQPGSTKWLNEIILVCNELLANDGVESLDGPSLAMFNRGTQIVIEQLSQISANEEAAFQKLRLLMEAYSLEYRLAQHRRKPASLVLEKLIHGAPLLYGGLWNESMLAVDYGKEGKHGQAAQLIEAQPSDVSGTILYNQACALNHCARSAAEDTTLQDSERTRLSNAYTEMAFARLSHPVVIETLSAPEAFTSFIEDTKTGDLAWLNQHFPERLSSIIQQVKSPNIAPQN